MKDAPEERINRSWKQPTNSISVAAVSEARRLSKQGLPVEEVSSILDGHGVRHTRLQLERWLKEVVAVKGYPIVHANDEPYLITPPETFAMNKRVALLKHMLDDAGLTLVEFKDKHDGRVTCVANAGTEETRIFSITLKEGDRRGDLNEASRMRRFARECGTPATQLAEKLKPVVEEFKKVAAVAPPKTPPPTDYLGWKNPPPSEPSARVEAPTLLEAKPMTKAVRPIPSNKGMKLARLTMDEQYRLIEWVKTQDITTYKNIDELNKAAAAFLKLPVADATLHKAMAIAGVKFERRKPINQKAHVFTAPILARNLLRVMEQLGIQPDDELKSLVK